MAGGGVGAGVKCRAGPGSKSQTRGKEPKKR